MDWFLLEERTDSCFWSRSVKREVVIEEQAAADQSASDARLVPFRNPPMQQSPVAARCRRPFVDSLETLQMPVFARDSDID